MSACGEGSGLSYVDSKREILFCFYGFFPTFSSLVIKEMQIKTKVVFFPLNNQIDQDQKQSSRKSEELALTRTASGFRSSESS